MEKDIMSEQKEMVNNPEHYGGGSNPYEAIKVIDAWDLGFCLGNTVKYISRAGKKHKEKVPTAVPTTITTTGGRWDTGLWDVAKWANTVETRDSWTSVTGIGYCGAVRMRVAPNATLYIDLGVDDDTSLAYEEDGIIAMQSARNTNAPCEIIAFNLKYENQTGGQL